MVAAIETTSDSRSRQRSLRPGHRDFRAASPRSFASEVYPDDLIYSCDIGMPLRLGGENRLSSIEPSASLPHYCNSRIPGSEFPRSHSGSARRRSLIIDHCSLVIERSKVAWQGKQGYQFESTLGPAGLQYVRQRWYASWIPCPAGGRNADYISSRHQHPYFGQAVTAQHHFL